MGIVTCALIASFYVCIAIAIALGVGLGVGLTRQNSSNSNDSLATNNIFNCSCGCSPINPSILNARIINGISADDGSWPWMVYLQIGVRSLCGGSLISDQHVLTAAHCTQGVLPNQITVYVGFNKVSERENGQKSAASIITQHPNYDSSTFKNDISILTLSSTLKRSSKVSPICLPSGAQTLPFIGEKALITGWGRTIEENPYSLPDNLQQAVVEIQNSTSLCKVTETGFCAGLGQTDSCQGDSGGPLATNVGSHWTVTGIVSSGQGCPGIGSYTRITAFISFINDVLKT